MVLRVNAAYPGAHPLHGAAQPSADPAPLPECLHYRFVSRDLILVDSVAELIVDFLPHAAPEPGGK